jgi:hypothetical protein
MAPSRKRTFAFSTLAGIGDLSYDPAATPTPSVVVIVKPLPVPAETQFRDGVKVCMVDIIRNHPRSVSPLIKSNNLLNNALCMQEALRHGGVEGVFRNYKGELSECSQSNLFMVTGGVVRTPPLEAGLLAGITRGFVFELGAARYSGRGSRAQRRRPVRRRRGVLYEYHQGADADRAGGRSHDRQRHTGCDHPTAAGRIPASRQRDDHRGRSIMHSKAAGQQSAAM